MNTGDDTDVLLQRADIAMYHAKETDELTSWLDDPERLELIPLAVEDFPSARSA